MILSYNGFSSTLQEILGIEEQFVSYGGSPADAIFFYNNSSMLIDGEGSSDEHINCLDGEYTSRISYRLLLQLPYNFELKRILHRYPHSIILPEEKQFLLLQLHSKSL